MENWAYVDGKFVDMIPVRVKQAAIEQFCADLLAAEAQR